MADKALVAYYFSKGAGRSQAVLTRDSRHRPSDCGARNHESGRKGFAEPHGVRGDLEAK